MTNLFGIRRRSLKERQRLLGSNADGGAHADAPMCGKKDAALAAVPEPCRQPFGQSGHQDAALGRWSDRRARGGKVMLLASES